MSDQEELLRRWADALEERGPLVPFNLVNPDMLIYPVYSPLRNRVPRLPRTRASLFRRKIHLGPWCWKPGWPSARSISAPGAGSRGGGRFEQRESGPAVNISAPTDDPS